MINIKAILGLASVALLLVTIYEQNNAVNRLKSQVIDLKKQQSILQDSLFIQSTNLGRYELSVEHLKEVDPKAAKQLTDFMDNETE